MSSSVLPLCDVPLYWKVRAPEAPRYRKVSALTKPRKHYFGDTGFAAIPAALDGPPAKDTALVENLLAIALFRHVEHDALERFAVPQRLFLWRSRDGREIDFVADIDGRDLPIESKYAAAPGGKDYESMSKAFGSGVMASRTTMIIDREILTVPAGVLLFLLG